MATEKKPEAKKAPAKKSTATADKAAATSKDTQAGAGVVNEETTAKTNTANIKRGPTVAKRSERRANAAIQYEDPEEKIESALSRTEQYLYNNGKKLLTILGVLVIVSLLILGYKYIYQANRAEKAGTAMFVAEQLFNMDAFEEALNGDGNNAGFLEIIDKFGATPQGNIAKHYAGICYLQTGDLDKAIDYLGKYKATKGAPNAVINAQNIGLQGDIYSQKGEYQKAADMYQKAANVSDNSLTAPYYLYKLGLAYGKLGKSTEAKAAFERITDEYPSSMEGRDIQKYISAEEQK